MGEVGRLDLDLMYRYRAAPDGSATRRRLLGELLAQNEGLVVTLVHQLRGAAPKPEHARFARGPSVRGANAIEIDEALNLGRVALMKAMDRYDPSKSRLSGYLRKKIFHELQCLVTKASIVKVHRDARKPDMAYFEDDDHMGRLLGGSDDDEDLEELEPVVDEPPTPAPVVVPAPRTALEELLEVHCRFAAAARVPALTLRGRLDSIMRAHQEHVAIAELLEQLDARGVRETRVRVPWSPSPVRAFAGVGLRCGVDPPDYEVRLESPGRH
jgi:hypothetical protein